MQREEMSRCPSCHAEVAGAFCPACGTRVAARTCSACAAPLSDAARFCPQCGAAVAGGAAGPGRGSAARPIWVVAGAAVILVAAVLVVVSRRPAAPPPAGAGEAAAVAPPDISNLSPRERFDRLYERVMRASESGDAAQMQQFGPMALLAYQQLDSADADTRYHAALLRLHTGDVPGAVALGDTILRRQPTHLLGLIILGTAARFTGDSTRLAGIYRDVRRVWDGEMKAGRPEYAEHRTMLDAFHAAATSAAAAPGAGG